MSDRQPRQVQRKLRVQADADGKCKDDVEDDGSSPPISDSDD